MRIVFIILFTLQILDLSGQSKVTETDIPSSLEDTVYTEHNVDVKPSFPGGEDHLFQQPYMRVKYPSDARNLGISGTVKISFIIEKDGSISHYKIVRHVYPSIDAEAMRVTQLIPGEWTPAMVKGHPVRYEYSVPVRFVMQ